MTLTNNETQFICLFHHADRARSAVQALENTGLPKGSVRIYGDQGTPHRDAILHHLAALQIPERDRKHLEEGLRDGGVLLALQAPENRSGEIEDIFHRYTADKIDETSLRKAPKSAAGGEVVVPVVAEQMNVGKREVDRGGVRVFRHIVEEPVEQTLNLHDERVVLDRRSVDRPASEADLRAGQQQVELIETAEVPVVQKVVRVVEEVRVGKVGSDHQEVVQDTVRHTEVGVETIDPAEPATRR